MKFLVFLPVFAAASTFASSVQAADSYRFYTNARFGYRVQYPSNLVAPLPESTNRDGRKFRSRDGKIVLTTYGSNNVSGRTLRTELARSVRDWRADGGRVTLQRATSRWFVVSGFVGNDIFYEKTVLHQGAFCTLIWEYPRSMRARLDAPVTRAFGSFAPQNFVRGYGATPVAKPRAVVSAPKVAAPKVAARPTSKPAPAAPRIPPRNGY